MGTLTPTSSGRSDLFGDGLAVQFVVDFPDLGHSERGHRESVETKGHLLLRDQRHRSSRRHLCLRVFTWNDQKRRKVSREKLTNQRKGENREDRRLKEEESEHSQGR